MKWPGFSQRLPFGRHRYQRIRNPNAGGAVLVLLGVLAVLFAGLWVLDRVTTSRRSATADVQIVSTEFEPGGGIEQTPQGSNIRYQYVVDGKAYVGAAFRPWDDVLAHHPKVCFNPADPADHLLVDERVRCGG